MSNLPLFLVSISSLATGQPVSRAVLLQLDRLPDFINRIPTIWVLFGGCLLFFLVLIGFLFLLWAESRWRLARRLRLSWKFMQIDALRPYANQIFALDRFRRHSGQFQREAANYMPDSVSNRWQQGQRQVRRTASDLPTGDLRQQVTEVLPGQEATTLPPTPQSPPPDPYAPHAIPPTPDPQIHVGRLPRHEGQPAPLSSDRLPVGRYVDRYQVDAFIGEGSTGTVYQVYDAVLGRKAILKIIHPQLTAQPDFTGRLTEAIQASASLDHPGIVAIEQYAVTPERTYLLREFITGPTLDRFTRQQQGQNQYISLNHTLRLAAQVADALAHAHRRGLVHGRIQPGNVLLKALDRPDRQGDPPLRAMLTDFGMARLFAAGDAYGDVALENMRPFMSPEHCRGEALDSRSDIYSLGMMLYQLTTQQLPFNPASLEEAHRLHLHEMPPLPTSIRPIIPELVEAIILKAIAKNPADRYQSGAEMADVLRQVVVKPTDVAAVYDQTTTTAAAVGDYQIIVSSEGEPAQTITIDDEMVSIGSATQNDIVLPGKGIAPQHVRLERTESGWQVVDLGSLHGSYLDSVQLLPDLPERWLAHQTLQLGPYMLRWQPYDPDRMTAQPFAGRPQTAVIAEEPSEAVRVSLNPEQVTVTPGERVDLQVNLTNRGTHVDHFGIQVDGLPAEWVTISEDEMQLMPGGRGHLLLTVHPPRHSGVTARDYTFRVVAVSRSNPTARGPAQARLTVRPFSRLRFEIQPEYLRNGGPCHVLLQNEGNQRLQARVLGRDPADAVRFEGVQEQVIVPAGEAREVIIELLPRERPFLGTTQFLPFEILVQPDEEEARIRPGQIEVRPFLPLWLPALLSVLLIVCCTGFFLFYSLWSSRPDEDEAAMATAEAETATAEAEAQAVITATMTPRAVTPTPVPYPASCAMIRDQQLEAEDGEYEIYYLGNPDWPFTVYCHDLQSRPAEYLPLLNVDGAFNYAMISYPEGALTTHYRRLRIFPSTLVVDTNDRTFATTLGSVPNYNIISAEAAAADYPVTATNYGRAEGCNRGNLGAPPGQANIDLRGSGFAIDESVQFVFGGGNIQEPVVNLTENDQVANLSIGGRCAHIEPVTQLRLVYVGQ